MYIKDVINELKPFDTTINTIYNSNSSTLTNDFSAIL